MHRTVGSPWHSETGGSSVQLRNPMGCVLPWTEKGVGTGKEDIEEGCARARDSV